MNRPSLRDLLWLTAYAAFVAAAVGGMFAFRAWTRQTYGSPAAQQAWEEWREGAQDLAQTPGPVRRRPPQSARPPALVLMEEHFGVCVTAAAVLSSILFGAVMLMARGAAGTKPFVDRSRDMPHPRQP